MPAVHGRERKFSSHSYAAAHTHKRAFQLYGIVALHDEHLIHGDIKPDNILIDDDGHIAITDFGLSCYCPDDPSGLAFYDVASGHRVGTPGYWAPEVRLMKKTGWPYGASAYSDIYSAGIVFIEIAFAILLNDIDPIFYAGSKEGSSFAMDTKPLPWNTLKDIDEDFADLIHCVRIMLFHQALLVSYNMRV